MEPLLFRSGSTPLLVSMPHVGTCLPEALAPRLTPAARALTDTDWHLPLLYDFLDDLGASVIQATHSRYLIDVNRPPDNASLYPGQATTGLVPLETFAGEAVYLEGEEPDADEIERRIAQHWRPYHERVEHTLAELRARYGIALLWEAHSIRSVVPRLFDGRLPDFNLGTVNGRSCDRVLAQQLAGIAGAAAGFTSVLDGRFTGGYITRHFGRPQQGIHAVQLELALPAYMDDDPPFAFRESLARGVRVHLRAMLQAMLAFAQPAAR